MEPLIIRNREITAKDLNFIQAVVHEHWDKGRTHISRVLCQKWDWVPPSGRLKDMACRELLLTLHRKELLDYPPPKIVVKRDPQKMIGSAGSWIVCSIRNHASPDRVPFYISEYNIIYIRIKKV